MKSKAPTCPVDRVRAGEEAPMSDDKRFRNTAWVMLLLLALCLPAMATPLADLQAMDDGPARHDAVKAACLELYRSKDYGDTLALLELYVNSAYTDAEVEKCFSQIALDLAHRKEFSLVMTIAERLKSQAYRDLVYTTVFIPVCIQQRQVENARGAIALVKNADYRELAESALANNDPGRINAQLGNMRINAEDEFFACYGGLIHPRPAADPPRTAPENAPAPATDAGSAPGTSPGQTLPAWPPELELAFAELADCNFGSALRHSEKLPDYGQIKVYAAIIRELAGSRCRLSKELLQRCLTLCVGLSREAVRAEALAEAAEAHRLAGADETARTLFAKALDALEKRGEAWRSAQRMDEFRRIFRQAGETELARRMEGWKASGTDEPGASGYFRPGIFAELLAEPLR